MTDFLDEFLAHHFARQPVTATFTGMHAHDAQLPDWRASARAAEVAELEALAGRLAVAQRDLPETTDAWLDLELARANADVRIAETRSGFFHDRNPALWTGEAIFGAVSLMLRPAPPWAPRLEALAARLDGVATFLEEARHAISAAPALWTARARRECAAAQRLFADGLSLWLDTLPPDAVQTATSGAGRVRAAGDRAVAAFAGCDTWLATLPDAGTAAMRAGEPLLALLVARGHFEGDAPSALLAQAEAEIVEARATLDNRAAAYGGWEAAQAAMLDDHPSAEGFLAAFTRRWTECREFAAAHDLVRWEPWPLEYASIPTWGRAAAPDLYWLFYRSPAPYDRPTTHRYQVVPLEGLASADVTQRLRQWHHAQVTLNHVVHHGALGHHVQNWHATFASRSRIGTIAAVDAASRIAMFLGGSMAEGWACYATHLADELGFLTPLESLSEQHTRVRMLARAICDLRLHGESWTFDQVVSYYRETVGMSEAVATAEAVKNSMFPGTALMYWLGTRTILSLRDRERARLGAAFTLRGFHDRLLSWGAVPVPLVARRFAEVA